MLSNAYFLAKFRFDTAENEPAKNLQNFADNYFPNFANPTHYPVLILSSGAGSRGAGPLRPVAPRLFSKAHADAARTPNPEALR